MKIIYLDHLFSKGYFVADDDYAPYPVPVLVTLATLFDIRITSGQEMASLSMITMAQRNIGIDVPDAFYRGFPETVRELTPYALMVDQLVHYASTYGFGNFDEPEHSRFEQEFTRSVFSEETVPKNYRILTEPEALAALRQSVDALLASTRPLSSGQYRLLLEYARDYGLPIQKCACKDTAVKLLLDTRCLDYAALISLPDVIRLVEQLQYQDYGISHIRKLNLKNRDRKLITGVLDALFTAGHCDVTSCYEKKRLWCGLLHHIHYRPVNEAAEAFVKAMRGKENLSVYSAYERCLKNGDIDGAIAALVRGKGSAALLRRLDYLLACCGSDEQILTVLNAARSNNCIVLLQLLLRYNRSNIGGQRTFRFVRFNRLVTYRETQEEVERHAIHNAGKSVDYDKVRTLIRRNLEEICKDRLGKVYVDESMKRMALPLQEAASMGGVGTLPRGSRLSIPAGKVIRAFTYWEKVNDIDLSVIGLMDDDTQVEFSWRSMYAHQSDAIAFSGDQTSGYDGGSEFFDIHVEEIKRSFPGIRYLIFSNNVYSGTPFSECICKAGYMQRDVISSGEIFEPKTVASSFTVNCDSTFAYLFAIDVCANEFVWLNVANNSMRRIAGSAFAGFLKDIINTTQVINLHDFAVMLATEVVSTPEEADVIFSDEELTIRDGAKQIRSCDYEQLLALMNR